MLSLTLGLVLLAPAPVRVFFIGNSVTDTVNYRAFAEMSRAGGREVTWGRHMIPGAPLFYMVREKTGFTEPAFGPTQEALTQHPWDVVTVQPFDRHLLNDNEEGDLTNIEKCLAWARAKNPKVRFYVYARWPRMSRDGKGFDYDKNDYDPRRPGTRVPTGRIDDFLTLWNRKYTGGWDGTQETRDYFHTVAREVNRRAPGAEPVRIIPVGHVMADLDAQMKEGKVPGYQGIYDLYRDGIHLNVYGSALVGMTFNATIFGKPTLGLSAKPYGDLDAKTIEIFQRTIDRVVRSIPETGVR